MKTLPKAEVVVKQAEEAFNSTLSKTTVFASCCQKWSKRFFVSGYFLGYVKGFETRGHK